MDVKRVQKIKKPVKLHTIFIRYLFIFCIITPLITGIAFAVFSLLPSYPANYGEKQLSAAKDRIASAEAVTPDLIPDTCKYALYTKGGKMVSGNLKLSDAEKAWKMVQNSNNGQDISYNYLKIPRKNEICIVRYSIGTQFKSPILRRYLPKPGLMVFILFCFIFILETILLAYSFGRKFTEKMASLQNAIQKIQNQDLNFTVESSGIFEIDNVLSSIDKMKEALKVSLKKQWDLEQARREQISALAHDIKTPLTIVRGNADLLSETEQTEEQKEYTGYIAQSAYEMEQYIKALIEISKAEEGYNFCRKDVESKVYIDKIHNCINALAAVKKLKVNFNVQNMPQFFSADYDLLQRAIMNIVSNAAEYSPENGEIKFSAEGIGNCIRFCITDFGKGFSKEDIKQAAEKFYMGDPSRTSKSHYGMGLYIVKSIVKLHNGTLKIENSPVTGGGQVTIEIPDEMEDNNKMLSCFKDR